MKQYECFTAEEKEEADRQAAVHQTQLDEQAAASGMSSTHKLVAKIDNYKLAATANSEYSDYDDEEGDSSTGPTVHSVTHGMTLKDGESNIRAKTSPIVLLWASSAVPIFVMKLSDLASKIPETTLGSLNAIDTARLSFEAFVAMQATQLPATCQNQFFSCTAVSSTVVFGRVELCLSLLELCRAAQRQGMAKEFLKAVAGTLLT